MVHANARLTPAGRLLLCQRIAAGRPVAHVAGEMGISRTCAYRWWTRNQQLGQAGLHDRPSTAHTHPRQVPTSVQTEICRLRRSRRYERAAPGELVHLDVEKLGRLRDGGGHRVHGRDSGPAPQRAPSPQPPGPVSYEFVHAAADDHSRLAYAEVHADERGGTCAGFLRRAGALFAAHGVVVQRVLTDNAFAYRHSAQFRQAVAELGAAQRFTRPYHPQTNGKVERFNRTLLAEWAYQRPYATNQQRTDALDTWLHTYNYHRAHTALGGHPPVSRVNNATRSYS